MYNLNKAAKTAINNYSRFNDKNIRSIPYFYAFFDECGAAAHHSEWDFGDATGRYLDALILCNDAAMNSEIPAAAHEYFNALKWFVSLGDCKRSEGVCRRPDGYEFCTPCINTFDIRSALMGLVTYYKKTKDPEVLSVAKEMIDGMIRIGIDRSDYFYLPYAYYTEDMPLEYKEYDIKTNKADPCHYGGGVHIHPLMLYYDITKDGKVLELCGKIVNFIVYKSGAFEADGSFWVGGYFAGEDGHFHSRTATVLGILMYAAETGNRELISWCDTVYNFARSQGTSYGFFPEGLGRKPQNNQPDEYPDVARHTEICGTADMIELALLFSRVGYDYYSHAEKYANQLIKSQLTDISGLKDTHKPDEVHCSYTKVAERYRGAFLGRTLANDLLNHGRYDNMGCCAAAGGRGIWALWENAIVYSGGVTTVNLWMSCENRCGAADISIKNNFGKFSVKIANAGTVKIRVAEFAAAKNIASTNGYYVFGEVKSGDIITLEFECMPVTEKEILCGETLTVTWQANIVKDVLPRGQNIPLYSGCI